MTKYTLAAVLALFTLGACDFLEVERVGKNDTPKHFSDMSGLRTAIAGTYRLMYNYYDNNYVKYTDAAADMITIGATSQLMLDQYNYLSQPDQEAGLVGLNWKNGYETIANANNILHYAPELARELPQNSAEIDRIMAEALFVRAAMHLFLCNVYAQPYNYTAGGTHPGVPVSTTIADVNAQYPRLRVAGVYAQVLADCRRAVELFADSPAREAYYASAMACHALQARVYQYMGEWESARDMATVVIDNVPLTPYEDYLKMFMFEDIGREAIFRLNGLKISSHELRQFYVKSNEVEVSDKFRSNFYDPGDIRLQLLTPGLTGSIKYQYSPDNPGYSPSTEERDLAYAPFVFRSSEMYLIRAEAYARLSEESLAEADLKEIMARAAGTAPGSVTLTYSDTEELIELIERERILELAFEGHRLFDIVRGKQDMVRDQNTTSTVVRVVYPNDRFVLPIPEREVAANTAMEQNPGYN